MLIRRLRLDHPGEPASPSQPRLPPDRSPRFLPPPADGQSSKLTNRCWAMSGATCDRSRAGSLSRLHTTGRFPIGPAGISPKLTAGSRCHGICRQPFANPDVIDPGPESLTRCSGAAGAERRLQGSESVASQASMAKPAVFQESLELFAEEMRRTDLQPRVDRNYGFGHAKPAQPVRLHFVPILLALAAFQIRSSGKTPSSISSRRCSIRTGSLISSTYSVTRPIAVRPQTVGPFQWKCSDQMSRRG